MNINDLREQMKQMDLKMAPVLERIKQTSSILTPTLEQILGMKSGLKFLKSINLELLIKDLECMIKELEYIKEIETEETNENNN